MSKVVVVRGKGGPEVLHVETRPVPEPGPHEVRVAVDASGVAYGDVMRRHGVLAPSTPYTPGYDIVGRIDALGSEVGSGVDGWTEGQRVAAMMPGPGFGGYAEHAVVAAQRLAPVPDELDPVDAIGLGLNYITAWQLIHRICELREGQRLLVHGAAGGVGTASLDLAKLAKLEVYGTASKAKHEHLRARGCTPIDYRSEDFVERIAALTPEGVDAVFDGIGGKHLRRSWAALRRGGMLVALGVSGDVDGGMLGVLRGMFSYWALSLRPGKRTHFYRITRSPGASWDECRDDWGRLMQLAADGQLQPLIGARLPLDEVREAHRLLDERAVAGKVVLVRSPA